MKFVPRFLLFAAAFGLAAALARAQSQPEQLNMALVGYDELQGRSAYQPVIHAQGGRWIAYIGHHGGAAFNPLTGRNEPNGTSIVDVTDPYHPKYLAHIPGEPGAAERGGAQMVRVCDGASLPHADKSKVYLLRTFGNVAHQIWDVTDPAHPAFVTTVVSGLRDTHKSWWECDSGIAYLVSGVPGWRVRRMTQVYDLSDPAHPKFIRNFGLPGQQPGATGPVPTELHGMISVPSQNRVYFGYGTDRDGIVQIVDRTRLLNGPSEPTQENLLYPEVTRFYLPPTVGAHTVFPVLGVNIAEFAHDAEGYRRNFLFVVNEAIRPQCREARQMVWVVDVSAETRPFGVATWTVPEASGGFCSRGGRFGSHSSNESFTPIFYRKLLFIAHFNAGVRTLDIRDPFHPVEVGYYIPATTERTAQSCVKTAAGEDCKRVIQTNNVEVDDRGYVYIVDRADTGMHILKLTGDAARIAGLP